LLVLAELWRVVEDRLEHGEAHEALGVIVGPEELVNVCDGGGFAARGCIASWVCSRFGCLLRLHGGGGRGMCAARRAVDETSGIREK